MFQVSAHGSVYLAPPGRFGSVCHVLWNDGVSAVPHAHVGGPHGRLFVSQSKSPKKEQSEVISSSSARLNQLI